MPTSTELLAHITRNLDAERGPALAGDAAAIWQALDGRFAPLLGPLSTELLFLRSLDANASAFPWLPAATIPGVGKAPFADFERSLALQPPEQVLAANRALLANWLAGLTRLIGARLAERFLLALFPEPDAHKNT